MCRDLCGETVLLRRYISVRVSVKAVCSRSLVFRFLESAQKMRCWTRNLSGLERGNIPPKSHL